MKSRQKVIYTQWIIYMFKKDEPCCSGISILIEVRMPILIKIKGYTRVRNGKVEKVNSYYRRVWGR